MIKIIYQIGKTNPLIFINSMQIRKMKPQQVLSKINNKLKAQNIVKKFNPTINNDQYQMEFQAQQKSNQKIIGANKHINNKPNKILNTKQYQQKEENNEDNHKKKSTKQIKQINQQSEFIQKNIKPHEVKIREQIQQYNQNPQLKSALKHLGKALQPIQPKSLRNLKTSQAALIQNKQIQKAVTQMKSLNLKDFSILIHKFVVNSSGHNNIVQKFLWKQVQQNFLTRFELTTDPVKIRSYAKVIYSLAKSKVHRNNSTTDISTSISTNLQSFQTKFALLLPSASHQSFTTIITSLSRMGPLSQQFSYIAQRLYYNKYQQFNPRERIQINYALTRNGRKVDNKLYLYIDSLNLKQIVTMLRCYANCDQLYTVKTQDQGKTYTNILQLAQINIIARKKQMNTIDIGEICNIYFQAMNHNYKISAQLQATLTQMYKILKRNINQVAFDKIWKHLPHVVNKGFLQIQFVQQIIKTLKLMRKKNLFPQRIWKPMRQSFKQFQNLQLKTKLQQIK